MQLQSEVGSQRRRSLSLSLSALLCFLPTRMSHGEPPHLQEAWQALRLIPRHCKRLTLLSCSCGGFMRARAMDVT